MNEPTGSAKIHHFYPHPVTGDIDYDEDGDPRLGWFFELVNAQDEALSPLIGPYYSAEEAEAACKRAWERGDY